MKKDNELIAKLYENIRKNDFFLCEDSKIDEFDWESYFHDNYMGIYSDCLVERYDKIKNLEPTPVGLLDQYGIVLNNGMEFVLNINYNNADQIKKLQKAAIADASIKKRQDIIEGYKHFDNIKNDEFVALVEFQDSIGRHNTTGEVGPYSKEVFSMLTQSVSDSLANNDMFSKTVGIMMLVENDEKKRLALYTKILQRKLKSIYPVVFVDNNTKSVNNVTILIATR